MAPASTSTPFGSRRSAVKQHKPPAADGPPSRPPTSQRRCAAGPDGTAVQQFGSNMNGTIHRGSTNWATRLLVGLVLILVGAAAATWGLAHYQPAARFLGIA